MRHRDPGLDTEFQSEYLVHRALWHAATHLHDLGEEDDSQGFWPILAAALFVFTAYEGFLNDLGERVAPREWKDERAFFARRPFIGTLGKTRFLAHHVGLRIDRARRPYRTVAELGRWRDHMVHPRTVRIHGRRLIGATHRPPSAHPGVFKAIERPTFVRQCFADVEALADQLLQASQHRFPSEVRECGGRAFIGTLGGTSATLRGAGAAG